MLAKLLASALIALSFSSFASDGSVKAKCSSTGTVSIDSYQIRFVRGSFSEGPKSSKSFFYVEHLVSGKTVGSLKIAEKDVKTSYNEETGALISFVSSTSKARVDIEIASRGSRFLVQSSNMNVDSTHLSCTANI